MDMRAPAVRRRFGYRRLHILMSREGLIMNHKKLRRLYHEECLQVRRRGGRKRALGTRAPMAIPQGRNQRWSLDFLSDTLADGRRFRILAVVDDFTRECLALVADTSLPVSRSRTPSSRASTDAFAMSCSTIRCSRRSPMRGRCSRAFKMTTTRSGHTVGSAISRRPPTPNSTPLGRNGPGRLSYLGAPRPGPLHHRATRAQMTPGLYSSLDERRGSGQAAVDSENTVHASLASLALAAKMERGNIEKAILGDRKVRLNGRAR